MASSNEEASYIDYETFLSPTFTPVQFANNLVTSTNNASDTVVDLTTPLSRVLFDVQEIDTHIDSLTTKSALLLLQHARTQSSAAGTVVSEVDSQLESLTKSYARLESEVIERHAIAEEVRLAASRLWVTVKIGRAVSRALTLGRTLEREMIDATKATDQREDHIALIHAAFTLQTLRALFNASDRDEEGEHLSRINVLNTLKTDLLTTSEQKLKTKAQQIVREFSLSSLSQAPAPASTNGTQTSLQTSTTHETKSRTSSALQTLYLLSSAPSPPQGPNESITFTPTLLLQSLTTYLSTSLTSSTASLARALSSLPTLPRALSETSARCKNIVALESLLSSTIPQGKHPLLEAYQSRQRRNGSNATISAPPNLLVPLLQALDTSSLPSYFWRSLASQLSPKVGEILAKGGVGARSLRGAKDRIRALLREAVVSGVEGARKVEGEGWDREVAVFVGAVIGPLGR